MKIMQKKKKKEKEGRKKSSQLTPAKDRINYSLELTDLN